MAGTQEFRSLAQGIALLTSKIINLQERVNTLMGEILTKLNNPFLADILQEMDYMITINDTEPYLTIGIPVDVSSGIVLHLDISRKDANCIRRQQEELRDMIIQLKEVHRQIKRIGESQGQGGN